MEKVLSEYKIIIAIVPMVIALGMPMWQRIETLQLYVTDLRSSLKDNEKILSEHRVMIEQSNGDIRAINDRLERINQDINDRQSK